MPQKASPQQKGGYVNEDSRLDNGKMEIPADIQSQFANTVQGLQSKFAQKGVNVQIKLTNVHMGETIDKSKTKVRQLQLPQTTEERGSMVDLHVPCEIPLEDLDMEPDPTGSLRHPLDGELQHLVYRAFRERRNIKLMGEEVGRSDTLRVEPPFPDVMGAMLTSGGAVDILHFKEAMHLAGHDFVVDIQGIGEGAKITPGVIVADGMRLRLRNVTIEGSKNCVYEQDGTAIPPLILQEDAQVEAISVIIKAGDERANPAYCANAGPGARLSLTDCDLTSTLQEFAINGADGVTFDINRSRVAGMCTSPGTILRIKDSKFFGNSGISATAIFSRWPSCVHITDTQVLNFRHNGISVMSNVKPNTFAIKGNKVLGCGEYGIEIGKELGTKAQMLRENTICNCQLGDIRIFEDRHLQRMINCKSKTADQCTTKNEVVRQQVEGKYCEGSLEISLEGGCGHFGERLFKVLDAKGSILGRGALPVISAIEQNVFVCGDAGTCEVNQVAELLGLRWPDGEFWPKDRKGPNGSKLSKKLQVQQAKDLIKKRKEAGQLREKEFGRAAGPNPNLQRSRSNEDASDDTKGGRASKGKLCKGQDKVETATSTACSSTSTSPSGTTASLATDLQEMPTEEPEKLQAQTEDESKAECVVCMADEGEKRINWVFESCGHRCLCKTCARKLRAHFGSTQVECPLCRCVGQIVPLDRYGGCQIYE